MVRSYCDAFFLHQKYVVEGLTPAQIAAEAFSSKKTVVSWLHRQKIPLKPEDAAPSQTPYGLRRVRLGSPQADGTSRRSTKSSRETNSLQADIVRLRVSASFTVVIIYRNILRTLFRPSSKRHLRIRFQFFFRFPITGMNGHSKKNAT